MTLAGRSLLDGLEREIEAGGGGSLYGDSLAGDGEVISLRCYGGHVPDRDVGFFLVDGAGLQTGGVIQGCHKLVGLRGHCFVKSLDADGQFRREFIFAFADGHFFRRWRQVDKRLVGCVNSLSEADA